MTSILSNHLPGCDGDHTRRQACDAQPAARDENLTTQPRARGHEDHLGEQPRAPVPYVTATRGSLTSSAVTVFLLGLVPLVNVYAFFLWCSRLDWQRRVIVASWWIVSYALVNTALAQAIDGSFVSGTSANGQLEITTYDVETSFFYWLMIAAIGVGIWLGAIGSIRWLVRRAKGTTAHRVDSGVGAQMA